MEKPSGEWQELNKEDDKGRLQKRNGKNSLLQMKHLLKVKLLKVKNLI